MYEQFYKYIVSSLLVGFLKKVGNKNGDRYYVILDDKADSEVKSLDLFKAALDEISSEIHVSGIFPTAQSGIEEGVYKTRVIELPQPFAPVIIGMDRDATEDYLVTMRNNIGEAGCKYENYSSLFILSENPHDGSNPLSSICTTCTDLRSPGKPLSVDYVVRDIRNKVRDAFSRDHERIYFDVYLTEISKRIEDGSSSIYDLIPALSALQLKTITKLFNELGFFPDGVVEDCQNHLQDKDVLERAQRNYEYFQKITDIMERDEDLDKLDSLVKLLDERLAKRFVNGANDEWRKTDFQEVLQSIERKNGNDGLELISVVHKEEGLTSTGVIRTVGRNKKKKSVTYAIICDRGEGEARHLKAEFNKKVPLKCLNNDDELEVHGKKVSIAVPVGFSKGHIIGTKDNQHAFYAVALKCSQDFFANIEECFIVTKKGEIQIPVAAGQTSLCFGYNGNVEIINNGETVSYNDQVSYRVALDDSATEDYDVVFTMDFSGVLVKFVIKVNVDEDSVLNPIDNPEKRDMYCLWEDAFLAERATRIVVERNELQDKDVILAKQDDLDPFVTVALNKVYDYYLTQKAGPTLLKQTRESRAVLENYLSAVQRSLQEIETGVSLPSLKYNLTRLGVVESNGRVYFSAFHPLMVAYQLEYDKERDATENDYKASELLKPFYLAPFIRYSDKPMRPCWEDGLKNYKNWVCYDVASRHPQDRALDITTEMVASKMREFIRHFSYLFQDKDSPVVISTIGIEDDRNVIRGILQFILKEYSKGVQRIELHEYLPNLMRETFFEKLNRLVSTDLIVKELEGLGEKIERKGEYSSQEIIHQLFSRVVLYKHQLSDEIEYSHIAFYQMDAGTTFIRYPMSRLRAELAFNGLVSIPSTVNKEGKYHIGFGTEHVDQDPGQLYLMAKMYNNLYANEESEGAGAYQDDVCLVKSHVFNRSKLLNSIYDNANWVTFLNPEVDIDFFYKQDLYVVYYTDQYSINAKYDSITVTRQIDQYQNLLKRVYKQYGLLPEKFDAFSRVMEKYFNCLNGGWLLGFVNKTESQVKEKMSLVAASIVMQRFMRRNPGIIWVPVSLEEILRVTGSIRLPKHYIFTKDDLGITGSMSDDLLMMGLDARDMNNLGLYLYPIEVKLSKNSSFSCKGGAQVSHTCQKMREHLFGEDNFTKRIFRTFFASQFLVNAEKQNANGLMDEEEYRAIEKCRYRLLNLRFTMHEQLPVKEMGDAALVSFYSQASHSLSTSNIEGAYVCEIHFSEKECFEVVANPSSRAAAFLEEDEIEYNVDDEENVIDEDGDAETGRRMVSGCVCEDTRALTINVEAPIQADTDESEVCSEPVVEASSINDASDLVPVENSVGMKIVLGETAGSKRKIIFEPNNTRMVSHPNMGIIGTMGTGKTQFARSVITQMSWESKNNVGNKPVGVLIFDYKGDYKDETFLSVTGGEAYKFNYPFNPLKLIVTPDLDGVNLPAVTADRISDSFAKAYGLGLRQQGNIKQVIIETYADFGITRDPSTWSNPVPTMEDVISKYFATFDAGDKAYVLFDKLRDYTIFAESNDACVSIFEWLDRVRVIDLTLYPDDTKKVIVSLILDLFYAEMRQIGESRQENGFRQLRSFIMVDEAHQFLKKDFNSLRSIISEGRMFGVGMILSTQNLGDFKSTNEDYSQFILSWVIHHVNSITKSEIASIFGATDMNAGRYMDKINDAKLFESVCKIGSCVNAMRDLPFFELIKKGQ